MTKAQGKLLIGIVVAAFALRAGARLAMGEADYWSRGYLPYRDIAENFAAGHGMCLEPGSGCAVRPPIYPFLVYLCMAVSQTGYPVLVIVESAIGAGTVLCAFLIGRRLFDERAGLIAAGITAVYPHYAWHDATLQETGLFTFFTALSVWLLLETGTWGRKGTGLAAGACLGLAVLTRVTLLPFALGAVVWVGWRRRIGTAAAVALPLALLVGAWMARNYRVLGAPVVNSEIGRFLWVGNDSATFSHYPVGTIDESEAEAWQRLRPDELRMLSGMPETAAGDWFWRRGVAFIRADPTRFARAGLRKVGIAFSLRFSPAHGALEEAVYALSYGPILALGLAGMVFYRRGWRDHILIYLAVATFAAQSAVFWAHSTHRVYLDVYLIVFAAALLRGVGLPRQS